MTPGIELNIDPAGNVTITVTGVQGPTCRQLTKELEEGLGSVLRRQNTADYSKLPQATKQQLGGGLGA